MMRKRDIKPKAVWTPEDAWRPGGPFRRKEPLKDERLMQIAKLEARIKTLMMKIAELKISVLKDAIADRRKKLEPLKALIKEENEHWAKHHKHTEGFFSLEREAQMYSDAIERFEAEISKLRGVAEGREQYLPRKI